MINDKQRIVHLATKLAYLAKHVGNDVSERTITEIHDQLEKLVDAFPRQDTEAPPTVAAYFLERFDETLGDGEDDLEISIESTCGEDCKQAIDAGADFIDKIRFAFNDDHPSIPGVIARIKRDTADAVRKTVLCLMH